MFASHHPGRGRRGAAGAPLHPDLRVLFGSFVAVALTFVASYALSQHAMRRIDAASDALAYNSAPSIEHLAALRTAARQAELLVDREVAQRRAGDLAQLERALARVDDEAHAYLVLSTFPGEKELWRELEASVSGFHGAVQRALGQLEVGASEAARGSLDDVGAAGERLALAAGRALEFNAANGRELALRIKRVRLAAAWTGYVLTASSALLALLAGALVLRQVRRYGALVDAYAALQQLRASELESFAGRAAHDIRNPVGASQMALDLVAARGGGLDAHGRELVERARRNLRRAELIIEGLLQFARAGARPSPGATADLASLVVETAAAIRPAADARRVEVRVEPPPSCAVAASAGVVMSLLSNLAQNALKYMGDAPVRVIAIRAVEVGAAVRVEVEDTGPGIPAAALDDIFQPFVRGPVAGAQDGVGLGLSTVRRLAEAHGGRAGVRSLVGQGSVFWFELPRAAAADVALAAPRRSPA